MVWGSWLPLSGGSDGFTGSESWFHGDLWWQQWDGANSRIMALEQLTKPSLVPGTSFGRDDASPGHSRPGLAVLACRGLSWKLAPGPALASCHPWQGEGVGGREASFCVLEEMASLVAAVVVQLDLGPAGVFSWCVPSCGSEAGQRRSAALAGEKEVNVGHFLRLSVAQCGGSGQDGAGGEVWQR